MKKQNEKPISKIKIEGTMFSNEEYLPNSREYFNKFRSSNLDDIFEDMRECRTGPGTGYSHFHRDNEVIDCLRSIYHNLEDQFSDLSIPGSRFTSPQNLVQTWVNFKNYLESQEELFSESAAKCLEEARSNPIVSDSLPFPLMQANSARLKVLDVLYHILNMEEVRICTGQINDSRSMNTDISEADTTSLRSKTIKMKDVNMDKKIKLAAAICTIVGLVFAIYSYIHPNNIDTAKTIQQPTIPASIQITNSPGANIINNNAGDTKVSQQIDQNNKPTPNSNSKPYKTNHITPVIEDTDKIVNLKSQYLELYSDIDLCNAEDRQIDVPKYRHAYALMQEIKVLATKTNDPAIITWINKETCDGVQNTGGIGHATNR